MRSDLPALDHALPGALLLGAPASVADLELVHDRTYVAAVRDGTLDTSRVRRLGFPWSESLVVRATRSVGGTLAALEWAMSLGAGGHIAGGTHHAFPDRGEGFCVFNDLAVAVRVAQGDHGLRRVAIVDLDVHQGNGTAGIFSGDPCVFTLSLHWAKNYPFQKEQSSPDVGLPDGCDDTTYLRALDEALERVVAFRPDLVLYQSGVDGLESVDVSLIPIRAGIRYFATPSLYFGGKVGIGIQKVKGFDGVTATAYSFGAGYKLDSKFDVSASYDGYSKNGSIGLVGVRLGYTFGN